MATRVFISYAHDDAVHEERVREFWSFLRAKGVDARADLPAAERRQDWAEWMIREVRDADCVLVVASPEYRRRAEGDAGPEEGRGVQWEARLIRERYYADQRAFLQAIVPVVLPGCSAQDIPLWMSPTAATYYKVSEYSVAGAEKLLRLLTGQPLEIEPPLGRVPSLPSRQQGGSERFHGLLLARGPSGQLPRLSELDDEALGVTPTRYSQSGDSPYVGRGDADETIRRLLAAPGPPFPFVVVWGNTKTGKSRTLVEGLRASMAHDPAVIVPRDGEALAELCRLGVSDLAGTLPAVVALDDLAAVWLEALTADVLAHIRQWAVIAATMTAQRRAEVLARNMEFRAAGQAALDALSGGYELTDGPPEGAERAEAERLYPAEHFDGTIAETLVGAAELIARYKASRDTHPGACAVLRAAIDCRRIGFSRAVTESQLWQQPLPPTA